MMQEKKTIGFFNKSVKFGKNESKAVKGFAILLMLYYHVVARQGRSLIPVWRDFWFESGNRSHQ